MSNSAFGKGVFFAAMSFAAWGVLPLYWRLLVAIDPMHILALRILGCLILVAIILTVLKNFAWLSVFKDPKKAGIFVVTAITLSANWGIYIWAVNHDHAIEASLGYYINPLVSIVLGLLFNRERLLPLQWAAFGLAALGVIILTALSGTLPWISIALAVTFGLYGLLKKKVPLPALESLGAETLAAAPVALFLLFFRFETTAGEPSGVIFGWQNISYIPALPVHTLIVLAFCGAVSAIPLYFFAKGAKLLPLSTLGFTQILSPTIQFFLGLFVFHEYFPARHFIAFSIIWFAVILYVISLMKRSGTPKGVTPKGVTSKGVTPKGP